MHEHIDLFVEKSKVSTKGFSQQSITATSDLHSISSKKGLTGVHVFEAFLSLAKLYYRICLTIEQLSCI